MLSVRLSSGTFDTAAPLVFACSADIEGGRQTGVCPLQAPSAACAACAAAETSQSNGHAVGADQESEGSRVGYPHSGQAHLRVAFRSAGGRQESPGASCNRKGGKEAHVIRRLDTSSHLDESHARLHRRSSGRRKWRVRVIGDRLVIGGGELARAGLRASCEA